MAKNWNLFTGPISTLNHEQLVGIQPLYKWPVTKWLVDLLPSSQFCTYVRKWESNAGSSQNLDLHPIALMHVFSVKVVLIHELLNVKFKRLFYFFVNNKKIDKKEIDVKRFRLKETERTSQNRGTRGTQRNTFLQLHRGM